MSKYVKQNFKTFRREYRKIIFMGSEYGMCDYSQYLKIHSLLCSVPGNVDP